MLSDQIDSDMKTAARAKDARRLGTLRMLKSQMKYRKDSASQYLAGGRPELAQNENAEITILETYLPRQLTDAELLALVRESVAASGAKDAKDMGAVMKVLMPKIAGRAEGKRVSDAVKSALSKPAS